MNLGFKQKKKKKMWSWSQMLETIKCKPWLYQAVMFLTKETSIKQEASGVSGISAPHSSCIPITRMSSLDFFFF